MKIVFFGTPEFAVPSLRAIVESGRHEVAAVVTAPDKVAGRGHKLHQSEVKQYAVSAGLPVLQPEKLKDEGFVAALRGLGADLFVVIAFRMLPEVVWTMPPLGTFNLHGSLLPRYRGAAPINRAIMAGETRTGVTTFFLKHEIDTGDIIDRRAIEIGPDENVGSVYDRLMHIGAELTLKTLDDLEAGTLTTVSQAEAAAMEGVEPCAAPKIFTETCRIDWSRPAQEIHNLVRGLSPYPGAWCEAVDGSGAPLGQAKVFATRLEPGADCALRVTCGDGREIGILRIKPAGKREMDAAEWLRGLRGGVRLE